MPDYTCLIIYFMFAGFIVVLDVISRDDLYSALISELSP